MKDQKEFLKIHKKGRLFWVPVPKINRDRTRATRKRKQKKRLLVP